MTRTALILGAGGLTGEAYEAGVLAALERKLGWDARTADVIVGTSAGSLVGALLRFGVAPHDLYSFATNNGMSSSGRGLFARMEPIPEPRLPDPLPRLPQLPSRALLRQAFRHPWASRAGLLAAAIPEGRNPMAPYAEVLRRLTGSSWPIDPLWLVAARLPLGERVVFGNGDCPDCDVPVAVCASCCVPRYFAPVPIDGQLYIDGGVHSPTNADVVADYSYDTVVVVSPMSGKRGTLRRRHVDPVRVWCRALLGTEVRRLRRAGSEVIVFQPGIEEQRVMGYMAFDEERCPRVAEAAFEAESSRLAAKRDDETIERLAA